MQSTMTLTSSALHPTMTVQITGKDDVDQSTRKKLLNFFEDLQAKKLFSACTKALEEWKDKLLILDLATLDSKVKEKNVFILCHFLFHVIRPYIAATKDVVIIQKQLERVELEYRAILQESFPEIKIDELIAKIHHAKIQKHLKDKKVEQIAHQKISETQEYIKTLFSQAQLSQEEIAGSEEILKNSLSGIYYLSTHAQQMAQTQAQILATQIQVLSFSSMQNSQTFVGQGQNIVQGETHFQKIQEKTAQLLKEV